MSEPMSFRDLQPETEPPMFPESEYPKPKVQKPEPTTQNGKPRMAVASKVRKIVTGKDEPPVGTRDFKPPKERKPTPMYRKGMFVKPLEDLYTAGGMVLMPFDMVCGQAVVQSAHRCAEALDELAREYEPVRRILQSIVTTSVVGKVFAAHLPILAVAAMHHGGGKVSGIGEQAEAFLQGSHTVFPEEQ